MGPALCQLRGRGGGHPGAVGVAPARPGPGEGRRQRLRAEAGSARVRARAPPPQLRLGPGRSGCGQRGAPWGGRSPGRALPSSLWARCSPGTRSQTQKEGTSISLLSRASELLAQPAMPSSPATPATQPSCYGHTFYQPFQWGLWGLPILETGKLRTSQEGGQRSKPLSPAQPLSVFRDLEEQSKGRKNRGQKE